MQRLIGAGFSSDSSNNGSNDNSNSKPSGSSRNSSKRYINHRSSGNCAQGDGRVSSRKWTRALLLPSLTL
jgi:hypothetical protein